MLSVNEVTCIVPGATTRRRGLPTELKGSSSTALAFFCYRPVTLNSGPTLIFIFLGQRRKGEGCTGRHCQEVACPFTVISARSVRSNSLIHPAYRSALWWYSKVTTDMKDNRSDLLSDIFNGIFAPSKSLHKVQDKEAVWTLVSQDQKYICYLKIRWFPFFSFSSWIHCCLCVLHFN